MSSNNRYSVDVPRDSIDDELDIVVSGSSVTDQDRDLLRADDEVVKALANKSKNGHNGKPRLLPNIRNLLPKKTIKFAAGTSRPSPGGDYAALGGGGAPAVRGSGSLDDFDYDDDVADYEDDNTNNGAKKKHYFGGQRLDTFRRDGDLGQNEGSSDEDDSGDIEIDLETQPGKRRRSRNAPMASKRHIIAFFLIVFAFIVFYSLSDNRNKDTNGDDARHGYKRIQKSLVSNGTHHFYPTTLVVSLDGFHPHYVSEELTPNLHNLFVDHSGVPYMTPVFPSSTFPNHWTLVTGLYPANHGIVGNTFFDPKLKKQFFNTVPGQSLQPVWWGGEPIWQTAAFQGVKSAVHMWPGSEVIWTEGAPIAVDKFNGSEPLVSKRDRVFQWIDTDSTINRPELLLTYVPDVDTVGHQVGISGPEIKSTLEYVDNFVGMLLQGINERNLSDIINVMIVSDHGMAPTSNDRLIFLEDLMDVNTIAHLDGWPLVGLRLKSGVAVKNDNSGDDSHTANDKMRRWASDSDEEPDYPWPVSPGEDPNILQSTYEKLKSQEDPDKFHVYLRDEMPKEWNFGGMKSRYAARIAPLWIVPQVGWSITTRSQLQEMGGTYQPFGVHGYNNTESLMRALFLATGPYFSDAKMYNPIPNVDVYNIICDTLNLVPARTDGAPVRRALQPLPNKWTDEQPYPGVEFHTEILKVNSTYDVLFGANGGSMSSSYHNDMNDNIDENDAEDNTTSSSTSSPPADATSTSISQPSETSTPSSGVSSMLAGWLHSFQNAASDAYKNVKGWVSKIAGH